jgi:hypothetical protein
MSARQIEILQILKDVPTAEVLAANNKKELAPVLKGIED